MGLIWLMALSTLVGWYVITRDGKRYKYLRSRTWGWQDVDNSDADKYEDGSNDLRLDLAENLPKLLLMAENSEDYTGRAFGLPKGVKPWLLEDVPLSQRNIKIGDLEELLQRHGMEKYHEYRESLRTFETTELVTYIYKSLTLYARCESDIVQKIWLSCLDEKSYALLPELLHEMGIRWQLVTFLERTHLLVDLSNENHIRRYLVGV